MKAVVLDGYTTNPGDLSWEGLEQICDVRIYDRTCENDVLERIGDAEIVITNKTRITREIIEQSPNMKYIGILATGYNTIDIAAATERNIPVANVPDYSTDSVAQLVFALLLEICHHVGEHTDAVKAGQWTKSLDFSFWNHPLIELSDKTLGIIGFGSIGQKVAKIAISFGMKVITYSRTVKKEFENSHLKFVSLDELYQQADVVSLHAPLTDETKQLINKESLSKMKDGVIIINTARGALIHEEDLGDALKSGKVYFAGVDVACNEPIEASSPLLKAKNTFITPHIAWAPKETRMRLMRIAVENVKAFLNQEQLNVVNASEVGNR